ncbi:MAG: DUF4393 domain-containing protein [Elusimicrobiota bacterium]|nr:DUF4393 domain-containing protein [Elusimicrobiota bacterium]
MLDKQIVETSGQNNLVNQVSGNLTQNFGWSAGQVIQLISALQNTFITKEQIDNLKKELEEKIKAIPPQNLVHASTNIWGTTFEALKWNLDEQQKHIKNMFINILTADIDKTKKSKVLPAYIEIVKQLSKDDAEFLKNVKFPVDIFEINQKMSRKIRVMLIKNNYDKLDDVIIDNLERLKIIAVENLYVRLGDQKNILDEILAKFCIKKLIHNESYTWKRGDINLTAFGKNFVDICL